MITDRGVVVSDKTDPSAAQRVREALAQAGISDVQLLRALATPADNRQGVNATAGGVAVIHKDPKFGAQNPQGIQGGGFALGGAEANVTGQRCDPACSGSSEADEAGGLNLAPPVPAEDRPSSGPAGGGDGDLTTGSAPGGPVSGAAPSESEGALSVPPVGSAATGAPTSIETADEVSTESNRTATSAVTPTVPERTERHPGSVKSAEQRRRVTAVLAAANATAGGEPRDLRYAPLVVGAALIVIVTVRAISTGRSVRPVTQEETL